MRSPFSRNSLLLHLQDGPKLIIQFRLSWVSLTIVGQKGLVQPAIMSLFLMLAGTHIHSVQSISNEPIEAHQRPPLFKLVSLLVAGLRSNCSQCSPSNSHFANSRSHLQSINLGPWPPSKNIILNPFYYFSLTLAFVMGAFCGIQSCSSILQTAIQQTIVSHPILCWRQTRRQPVVDTHWSGNIYCLAQAWSLRL